MIRLYCNDSHLEFIPVTEVLVVNCEIDRLMFGNNMRVILLLAELWFVVHVLGSASYEFDRKSRHCEHGSFGCTRE